MSDPNGERLNVEGDEVVDDAHEPMPTESADADDMLSGGVAPEEELEPRDWTLPDTVKGPRDHIANAPFGGRDPGEPESNVRE